MKLRDEGKTRFIGVTGAHLGALKYMAEHCDCVDVILTFGRYNLMDTTLIGFFDDLLEKRKVGILNSSILLMSIMTDNFEKYLGSYQKHPRINEIKAALEKAKNVCHEHGTELGTVAAHFGMRSGTVWHHWFPAYDPQFQKQSPGLIILWRMAQSAEGLGLTMIDMGLGDFEFKLRFANAAVPLAEGRVGASWFSALRDGIRQAKRAVKSTPLGGPARSMYRWVQYRLCP
jgi:hypothetical protein